MCRKQLFRFKFCIWVIRFKLLREPGADTLGKTLMMGLFSQTGGGGGFLGTGGIMASIGVTLRRSALHGVDSLFLLLPLVVKEVVAEEVREIAL